MSNVAALGKTVRSLLMSNTSIKNTVTKLYPIVADKANCPYIVYRRVSLSNEKAKCSAPVEDGVVLEVLVVAEDYDQGLALADKVRDVLDVGSETNGTAFGKIRRCNITNWSETWMDDAYVQDMYFNIKIE